MARGRRLRSGGRITGGELIEHLDKDIVHVHEDIEHVIADHTEPGGSEVREHLEEVDKHLHDLMAHSKDLKNAIPLALLSVGEEGEIVEMRGGRGMVQRLSEMGFTNTTRVKVISSSSPGPVLVGVRDARIALGRGVAMKIMVNTGGKR
ncbi:Fe2+ transport system protein FeoA [Methanophagales archaeon]|nr:Fe2+ transport system protein FeoA [Methanophagales archaeon]